MSVSDLSKYISEFLENLTDDKKRNQGRRRLRDGFKFSSDQPPKNSEEEIIREKAKRILQNRYGFSEVTGKPGVKWFNRFLKDYDLIPKYLRKLGAVYGAVAHEAKNMAHAYTIAGECLRHSSDNHTSPVQNYV
ncbi:1013_t:CDS:2, partial [Racocetra fulgida]